MTAGSLSAPTPSSQRVLIGPASLHGRPTGLVEADAERLHLVRRPVQPLPPLQDQLPLLASDAPIGRRHLPTRTQQRFACRTLVAQAAQGAAQVALAVLAPCEGLDGTALGRVIQAEATHLGTGLLDMHLEHPPPTLGQATEEAEQQLMLVTAAYPLDQA